MRKIVAVTALPTVIGAVVLGSALAWRRNPRIGTAFVNSVVDPMVIRRGIAGSRGSEIGTLEHIGRKSGERRLTPVHPTPTQAGFRIIVPLGMRSEWARNVIAAGHCRLMFRDDVFDLDEPAFVSPREVRDLPWPVRRVMAALDFRYLSLRTFAAHRGTLEMEDGAAASDTEVSQGSASSVVEPELATSVR